LQPEKAVLQKKSTGLLPLPNFIGFGAIPKNVAANQFTGEQAKALIFNRSPSILFTGG